MDTDGHLCPLFNLSNLKTTGAVAQIDSGTVWLIVLFVALLACNAYCSFAESSFSAMNKIRVKAKADDGDKRAKTAIYISNNFDRALTTLLVCNNIVNIAAASVTTLITARLFPGSATATAICAVVTTLIIFLFSEMIPKSYANDRSETTAIGTAKSLRLLMKLVYPLAAFFSWISSLFSKLASRLLKTKEEASITEDELYDIIDTIEKEGVMDEEQGELFKSALDFSGTCAKDVMTMRDDICAIDIAMSNKEILEYVQNTNHSRLPVYRGSIDNIIGTLQIRYFLRAYLKNPNVRLRTLLMPCYRVRPESMIDDLLDEMRQHKFYLGVVSDEEGKTLGLVTIEDFLEELVGEIWDEDDVVDDNFVKLGGNRFLVNTHMTLSTLSEKIGIECPEARAADFPLISIVLENFGRLPEERETFIYHNLEFTIEEVENNRIVSVVVKLLTDEDLAELLAEKEAESTTSESDDN